MEIILTLLVAIVVPFAVMFAAGAGVARICVAFINFRARREERRTALRPNARHFYIR